MMKIIRILLLVALYFILSSTVHAATITAASCTQTAVQNAINMAMPGDTVNVPAGNCSWGSGISLSGINLIGAGSSTSGTVITSGGFSITKHASATTRVSGFRFTGSDTHGSFSGSTSARAFVIDHSYFFLAYGGHALGCNSNGGVISQNTFHKDIDSQGAFSSVLGCHAGEDWSQPPTMGNADVTGERNIYLEDNIFENIPDTVADGDEGGRLVVRHNTFRDSGLAEHSGGGSIGYNDTSTTGHRHTEIYNNTFIRTSGCSSGTASIVNENHWIWLRGGTGVIANNAMDNVNNQCYGNKVQIRLGVGCNSADNSYPIPFQIGQAAPNGGVTGRTDRPVDSPIRFPLLIFGNTAGPNSNGPAASNFIAVDENGTGQGASFTSCSNPGNYVRVSRDYYLTNQWNWVPFTYPHPLTGTTPPPPQRPVITSPLSASGTVGTAFSYQITATNSPTSYGAAPLPAGLSINTATGLISGIPITAGTSAVSLTATNAAGSGMATLTLTVSAIPPPPPPVITSPLSAIGTVGTAFSYQITATNLPTSYGATGLPAGLTLNSGSGLISGTPVAAGSSNVTLSATNSGGTSTAVLSLIINAVPPPLTTTDILVDGQVIQTLTGPHDVTVRIH